MSTGDSQAPRGIARDHLARWLAFAASPAAPQHTMSALELDGYLTGVLVSPSLVPPSQWMSGLWGNDAPVFDDGAQAEAILGSVGVLYNEISTRIVRSLRRLEAEKVCDYRPAFQPVEGKPSRADVIAWVRGFSRAMSLTPEEWIPLIEDQRTQPLMIPFFGFVKAARDPASESGPDLVEESDEAAGEIPRSILLLRKIAEIRAERPSRPPPMRATKTGRNNPCPCGSGKKFKRCCGQA